MAVDKSSLLDVTFRREGEIYKLGLNFTESSDAWYVVLQLIVGSVSVRLPKTSSEDPEILYRRGS